MHFDVKGFFLSWIEIDLVQQKVKWKGRLL